MCKWVNSVKLHIISVKLRINTWSILTMNIYFNPINVFSSRSEILGTDFQWVEKEGEPTVYLACNMFCLSRFLHIIVVDINKTFDTYF